MPAPARSGSLTSTDGAFATQSLITGTVAAQGIAVTLPVPFAQVAPAAPPAFPATPQGTLSAPQKLTITNTGQRSLSITGLSFTGADAGEPAAAPPRGSASAHI
jgi:hypothetical protein